MDNSKRLQLYSDIIDLMRDIKLTESPAGLASTLRRHKPIALFLRDTQSILLCDYEDDINSDN